MTKLQFDQLITAHPHFRPLPGKCVILLDKGEEKVGSIHVPETARGKEVKGGGYKGKILAISRTGKEWEQGTQWGIDFSIGDHVLVGLHLDEVNEEVVWASNGQVEAVIT